MNTDTIIQATRNWVENVVVGYNLCPFAKRELMHDRVRFQVTDAQTEEQLLQALHAELQWLEAHPEVETTLLIHPRALPAFEAYNEFLATADGLLAYLELEGIYQIASFHPEYRFEGTTGDEAENYTNRSPYPMLHLLREASLEAAIDGYPDVEGIPARNIARLNELGAEKMRAILARCLGDAERAPTDE